MINVGLRDTHVGTHRKNSPGLKSELGSRHIDIYNICMGCHLKLPKRMLSWGLPLCPSRKNPSILRGLCW